MDIFAVKAWAKSKYFTKTHEHHRYFGGNQLASGQCCQLVIPMQREDEIREHKQIMAYPLSALSS